jgi:hypothetical protein
MRTWSWRIVGKLSRLALSLLHLLATTTVATFQSRTALELENLALRHQLVVLQRSVLRPKLTAADRFFWARLPAFARRLPPEPSARIAFTALSENNKW